MVDDVLVISVLNMMMVSVAVSSTIAASVTTVPAVTAVTAVPTITTVTSVPAVTVVCHRLGNR